ncbi:MAG: hypothetical protein RLZ35_238 [Pseudomonadota bacterium]|jgi:hypothetical protein
MTVRPGIYKHYKGMFYQVLGISRHSETLDILVVYQALDGDYGLWVRPVELFTGTLFLDGKMVQRFTWISEGTSQAPALR